MCASERFAAAFVAYERLVQNTVVNGLGQLKASPLRPRLARSLLRLASESLALSADLAAASRHKASAGALHYCGADSE
jgi:hypothetical protein